MTEITKPFKFAFGIIFLTLGILFLLINLNVIKDLSFIGYMNGFWAIGLIIAGILIMLKQKVLGIIVLTISIILGCLILCAPTNYNHEISTIEKNLEIKEDYDNVSYNIDFGAGKFLIKSQDNNEYLVQANAISSFNQELRITEDISNSKNNVRIYQNINGGWNVFNGIFNEESKNEMNISLNSNFKIKEFDLDFGAAESIIDLRELNIEELDLDFGASDVTIYFDENIDARINCGASDIKLLFPKDKNIVIETEGGLIDVSLEGFTKINDKYYNNYEASSQDIKIDIEAGVSSISGGFYDE